MAIPFLLFWVLVILCRGELGFKGVVVCVLIWGGFLFGFMKMEVSPYVFIGLQAVLDAILILILFGGDIRIR